MNNNYLFMCFHVLHREAGKQTCEFHDGWRNIFPMEHVRKVEGKVGRRNKRRIKCVVCMYTYSEHLRLLYPLRHSSSTFLS